MSPDDTIPSINLQGVSTAQPYFIWVQLQLYQPYRFCCLMDLVYVIGDVPLAYKFEEHYHSALEVLILYIIFLGGS